MNIIEYRISPPRHQRMGANHMLLCLAIKGTENSWFALTCWWHGHGVEIRYPIMLMGIGYACISVYNYLVLGTLIACIWLYQNIAILFQSARVTISDSVSWICHLFCSIMKADILNFRRDKSNIKIYSIFNGFDFLCYKVKIPKKYAYHTTIIRKKMFTIIRKN